MRASLFLTIGLIASFSVPALAQYSTPTGARGWRPAGSGGYATSTGYAYDDGLTEYCIGANFSEDICWLQRFDAENGADVIVSVSTAYGSRLYPGSSPPNGSTAHVVVWDDPNDDGNPHDCVFLTQVATTIENGDTDFLNTVAVPPTPVTGVFFVGVYCNNPPTSTWFPGPLDLSQSSLGRAWVASSWVGSPFDPVNLGSTTQYPPVELDSIGFFAVYLLRAAGQNSASSYCIGKLNSLGCTPSIGASGAPSATQGAGFFVTCGRERNRRSGQLIYGVSGPAAVPFLGGTLCLTSPMLRTPPQSSGGSSASSSDCSGAYSLDMNAFASGALGHNPSPALTVPGTQVYCQWLARDNDSTFTASLSNALQYTVGL